MSQQVYEQAFAVESPARLSLRNIRGKVTMRPAKDGQLAVKAVKHLQSGDSERTEVEMWQSDEGNVFIATRFHQGLGGRPCQVDYEVHVPAPCTIALRCVSGGVLLEQLQGRFRVKMVSGQMDLNELAGKLQVRSVSGDISAVQLTGQLQLETVSGNVQIAASQLAAVRAKTVNGNLTLETPLGNGPYRFETVSGAMRLLVPAETQCEVTMQSLSGRLRVDGQEQRASPFARRQQARLGQGGPLVHFRSVSGDLAVKPTAAVSPAAAQSLPAEPAPEKPLAGV